MNRTQFEDALKSTFYPQVFNNNFECFEAIFTNDKTKMDGFLTRYLRAQGRIAFYLSEWDAAPDQPAKDAVAGSVTSDLGSASVDPSTAMVWPPSGGMFGNVMGPSTSTDSAPALFDSTSGQLLKE